MSCSEKCRILLVGTGGYAQFYLETLFKPEISAKAVLIGAADPFMSNEVKEMFASKGVKTFGDMQEAYDALGGVDLTICVTPLPYHLGHIRTAIQNGSHVLCEKPAAPVMEQLEPMLELERTSGKCIGIGFQWSFAPAMLACKRDVLSGKFGKALSAKVLVLWPRPVSYFTRGSGWGGKRFAADGTIINDSVASNATAHYLHNLFFMLGGTMNTSAMPVALQASTARANSIENYDTVSLKAALDNGAEVLYLSSHAVEKTQNPLIEYRFERGVVKYNCETNELTAYLQDGSTIEYGSVDGSVDTKVSTVIDAVQSGNYKSVPCTPETAKAHVYTVDYLFRNTEIVPIPAERLAFYDPDDSMKKGVFVPGLGETLREAYNKEMFVDFTSL